MSNYTKTTDFEAKDSLPTGDSGKIIRGAEFETEFDAIATAIATKADTAGPTFTGTLTFDTISDGTISIAAFVDEDDMSSNSAVLVPTQQSVKAYVDAVTTELNAQDLDVTTDSGTIAIDLDTETLTVSGGTGIDTSGSVNTVTFAIDSTVATLTGTQTLTNKTLTSPDVNTPDIDGGTIDGATIATSDITVGTGKTLDVSSGTLTLADDQISGDKVEGGTIASTTITSLASTTVDTTNLEVTNIKAKDGTSAGSIADTTGVVTLASSVLTTTDINGGTIDGATIGGTTAAAGSFTTISATGNITVDGTVDGRDVATDGTKLDTVETNADVTDTTNVTAAGAVMDSELTNETAVKSLDQGVATTDSPTFAGLTTTADVSFGDNDKAIFGAGSDLQIYHDGSNSYIEDAGTGVLFIKGTGGVYLRGKTTDEDLGRFLENGAVDLYYDGSSKLSTTSTGIDVTGTVTADGISSSGDITITESTPSISFVDSDGTNQIGKLRQVADTTILSARNNTAYGNFKFTGEDGSTEKTRLQINGVTGDISFYEDTGTTAKLFWDASAESLGVGTSSPSAMLTLDKDVSTLYDATDDDAQRSGTTTLCITNENGTQNTFAQIAFDLAASGQSVARIVGLNDGSSTSALAFVTEGSNTKREVMRLDGSGNVGIGTSSPQALVDLKDTTPTLRLTDDRDITWSGNETLGNIEFFSSDTSVSGSHVTGFIKNINDRTGGSTQVAGALVFGVADYDTAASEAMRIDSSGNLLVGTTTVNGTGITLGAGDYGYFSRSGDAALFVNRSTSDGSLIELRKADVAVGSIGTKDADLYIGTDDTTLRFVDGSDKIYPANASGNARDAAIDLGNSNARFKDLYLSGGVYVGGTGSANKLDDYEEGTWTPTFEGTTSGSKNLGAIGRYTKTGRIVHITFNASNVDFSSAAITGTVELSGLPFNIASNGHGLGNIGINNFITGGSDYVPYTYATDTLRFSAGNTSQLSDSGLTQSTTRNIAISLTYEAS